MKVAVIGGTGFLGKAIAQQWSGDDLLLAGSREVDVRDSEQVRVFLRRHQPDWVVLAAAVSNVDRCEREPELADAVNHRGAAHVARACADSGTRLMFLSTDYVFSGSTRKPYAPEDPPGPLSAYARSKVAGERAVREILSEACIARTSWLFGAEGKCFPNALLDSITAGQKKLRAIVDQVGVPNYTGDVARGLRALVHAGATGTVHVTNPGATSWYEFARVLVQAGGHEGVTVEAVTAAELRRPAMRPPYSAMSDDSLRRYGITLRHWRDTLPDYLGRRHAPGSLADAGMREVG